MEAVYSAETSSTSIGLHGVTAQVLETEFKSLDLSWVQQLGNCVHTGVFHRLGM
jgi:hypothetical protein